MPSAERSFASLALCVLLACHAEEHRAAPQPLAESAYFLGDSVPLAKGSCRLQSVSSALTEPRAKPVGRPPEDIHVVDAALVCTRNNIRVSWFDDARKEHAVTTRTVLNERQPEHTLFEVDATHAGVVTPRRYDAHTGDPIGTREHRRARLVIGELDDAREQVVRSHAISPWRREHDHVIDAFVDQLARTLASGAPFDTLSDSEAGHAAIHDAAELYGRIATRADQLVTLDPTSPIVSFTLERAGAPLATFRFEVERRGNEVHVLRALDLEQTRIAAQCVDYASDVSARIEHTSAKQGDCNLLGIMLPVSCQDADPALLVDALRARTQCELDPALQLDIRAPAAPPDFELRMRRTRSFARLDRAPHYSVVLQRNGRVHFEGQARVAMLGAHEGRTSFQMVAALHALFSRMQWFEHQDGQTCRATDDRGDTIDVRANGRSRMLRDRDGCRAGFSAQELALARAAIERAAGVNAWLGDASDDSPDLASPRNTEIWTVAAE